MKSLNIFGNVMSAVSIMSGISALIFSAVTFTNTEVMKKDVSKHHNELGMIDVHTSKLMSYKTESIKSLKRLDRDIQTLFNDLGNAYKREERYTEAMALKFNKTRIKIMKTYEKIRYNTEMIESTYKYLNSRLIAVEGAVGKNRKKIEYIQKFLEDHTRNKTGT